MGSISTFIKNKYTVPPLQKIRRLLSSMCMLTNLPVQAGHFQP